MLDTGLFNYYICVFLFMVGLYTIMSKGNLVKKVIGLNMFQVAVIMLYVTMGVVDEGTAPILVSGNPQGVAYNHPLPSVLMLTAIVVGVATTALALALVVRINEAYGTIEEGQLEALDAEDDAR